VKRTTGIPRSFLKTVEKPAVLSNDGTTDDAKLPTGVMVNAEGEYVIAEPDKASWEQFQAKTKSSAEAQKAAAAGDKELQERGLECSIDKRIFIDPMKTPCCEKTYCNECITNALIESDFTCPGCQTDGVLIDDLKPDDETSSKIKAYLEEKNAAKRELEKERSTTPTVKKDSTPVEEKAKTKSPSPKPPVQNKSPAQSPKPSTSAPASENAVVTKAETTVAPKKRPAEELLENPKIPKAPKAMQQQEAQKQAMLQQQVMMNGMNSMPGFPNMPQFDMMNGMNGFPNNGFNPNANMNQMMNFMPMMGMNPMMSYGGFPNMNMNNMYGNGGGFNNMGMMNGGMGNGANQGQNGGNVPSGPASGFPNQQKTVFAEPLPNEEDNAYFRKPVNPHRHQARARRARPSDYREL
jgi:protein MPE1